MNLSSGILEVYVSVFFPNKVTHCVCDVQLTVNEAAAQLCMRDMALLTRRDELFGLARQISREVTYKYTYRTSK